MVNAKSNRSSAKSKTFSSGFGKSEYGGEVNRSDRQARPSTAYHASGNGDNRFQHSTSTSTNQVNDGRGFKFGGGSNSKSMNRHNRTTGYERARSDNTEGHRGNATYSHQNANNFTEVDTSFRKTNSSVSFQSPFREASKHDGPNFKVSPLRHTQQYMYTGPSGQAEASRSPSRGGSSPTPFIVSGPRHSYEHMYTGPPGQPPSHRGAVSPGRGAISPTPFIVSGARHSFEHPYTGPSGQPPAHRGSASPGRGGVSPTPFIVSPARHSAKYMYTGPSGSGVINTSTASGGPSKPFMAGGASKHVSHTKPSNGKENFNFPENVVNDFEQDMQDYEYEEPTNRRGGSVADSVVHRDTIRHQSEHNRQYPWPAQSEPVKSFRPAASQSLIAPDTYQDADMYQSEYAVRCAELKAKQRELMAKNAASQQANRERAGVKSVARQALDRVGATAPVVIPYNVGMSESKKQFTWKETEPVSTVAPKGDNLNLFRSADAEYDALKTIRDKSVAKEDFINHTAADIMRGIQERSEQTGGAHKSNMTLAWDDAAVDEEPREKAALNRSTRDNYRKDQPMSEYTRKYFWKEGTASPARPNVPVTQDESQKLNLFAGRTDFGVSSEYNLQFVNHDLEPDHNSEPAAGITAKSDTGHPSHFAWGGDGVDNDDDEVPRKHRYNPQNNSDVLSEYHRKYQWKDPEPRSPHRPQVLDQGHEGSILGLDQHAMLTSQWQSEYRDHNNRTLNAYNSVAPIAGVPSHSHEGYPTNYAWKDEPRPVVTHSPKHRNPVDLPMTEYEAKFYEMPFMEKIEKPKSKTIKVDEPLNLFDDSAPVNANANRLKSEYSASFHPFSGDRVAPIKAKVSENPAQFAWSVIDGEAPPKPIQTKKSGYKLENSEYNSKYQWFDPNGLRGPPPAGIVSQRPAQSSENPICDAPDTVEEWTSESADAARIAKLADRPSNPAGIKSVSHSGIPTFYAWEPEDQIAKPKPVRFPGEIVHSEYEEQFKAWKSQPSVNVAPTSAISADTQLDLFGERKPFVETTEHRDQFVSKDVRKASASPAGRSKPLHDELPTQFAWPLIDGERVKEPRHRPSNPTAAQLSEYDTKYSWPQGVQKVQPVRKTTAKDENGIFPSDVSSADWQSEADAHFVRADPADNAVTAGIVSEKLPTPPSFYAWPEVPPSVAPPRPPVEWEPMNSEYGDKFVPKLVDGIVKKTEPVKLHDTLNLFERKQPHSSEKLEGLSEYDDKFSGKGTSGAAPVVPPPDRTPHQFAWPLIDGVRKKEPIQHSADHPFHGTTEYDDRFAWPSEKDTLACHSLIRPKGALNKTQPTVILPANPAMNADAWESEYDARCAALKQKQQAIVENAKVAAELPPAGIPTIRTQHAPTYYAWKKVAKQQTPIVVNKPSTLSNAVTEYNASFAAPPTKPLPSSAVIGASLNLTKDSLEASTRKSFPFVGITEYDDKFAVNPTTTSDSVRVIHAQQNNEKTLRGSNVELGVTAPASMHSASPARKSVADLPVAGLSTEELHHGSGLTGTGPSSIVVPNYRSSNIVSSGAVGIYSTETSDKFVHPVSHTESNPQHIAYKAAKSDGVTLKHNNGCSVCYDGKENQNNNKKYVVESESRDAFSWPKKKVAPTASPAKATGTHKLVRTYPASKSTKQNVVADDQFSVHTQSTVTTVDNKVKEDVSSSTGRAVQPTTATTSGTIESNTSTLGTSTKKGVSTTDTEKSVGGASSSTITSVHNVEAVEHSEGSRSNRNANYIDYQKKNRLNAASGIPGLRYNLDNYQAYRSRSAPPRRYLSQSFTDQRYKSKMFVDQDTTSNPVLIHKRYPQHSDRQLGRWSTETSDKFHWKRHSSSPNHSFNA